MPSMAAVLITWLIFFSKYGDESLEIRKLRIAKEAKNTMPISKKTLRQPGILPGVVQAIGGLLGCHS